MVQSQAPAPPGEPDHEYEFILFVAGDERNSRAARENLVRFCREELDNRCEIRTVDVLEDIDTAAAYDILLTPSLVVVKPKMNTLIVGTLKDAAGLRSALLL